MFAIFKREFKSYFQTVIGWLFVAAFLCVFGLYFYAYNLRNGYPYISYTLSAISFVLLIAVPILSMRCFTDERRTKTDQLILTSPVSIGKIVAGKYLAMVAVFSIDILVFALSPLVMSLFGTVGWGECYVSLFGFWLYGASCIAVGMFVSSLTESQIISAIVSFALLFMSYMMTALENLVSSTGNILTKVMAAFDLYTPFDGFVSGCLDIKGVVYYLTVIILLCFLTTQSIQKRRWSMSVKKIATGMFSVGFIVVACVISVVVNLVVNQMPETIASIDCSSNQIYSITDETKEFLSGLENDITIYVLNSEASKDETIDETLSRYETLSKHIKVEYVSPSTNPYFYADYTDSAPTTNSLIVVSDKRSRVIDFYDIYDYQTSMDYSTYTYNNQLVGYDAEGQITSAIEYCTMDTDTLPVVYTVTGHDETAIGDAFSDVLGKANVMVKELELLKADAVPDDAVAVIINSPATDFSADDAKKVTEYLRNGGKAIITGCYAYNAETPNFNSIIEEYGVSFKDGVVCEGDSNYYLNGNPLYLLPSIDNTDYTANAYNGYIFTPASMAIEYDEDSEASDITYTPLLETTEKAVLKSDWQDIKTAEYEDGDETGVFTLGLAVNDSASDSELVVIGTEYFLADEYNSAVYGNNATMFTDIVSKMVGEVELATSVIPEKEYSLSNITVSTFTAVMLWVVIMLIIPIILIVAGIAIWAVRRKK